MECLYRWATFYLLLYLSNNVANVFCQNIPLERIVSEVQPQTGNSKREVIQTQTPSKAQLINALFSYAASKGLLPKTTQIIQSATLPQEQLQAASQNSLNTFNIEPLQPQTSTNYEKPIIPSTPIVSTNPISNQILPPITPSLSPYMATQPTVRNEVGFWTFSPTAYQVGCLENSPQPSQTVWQIPQQPQSLLGINSCPPNQPVVYNEGILPYPYLQFTPPNCVTPINTEYRTTEYVYETECGTLTEEPLILTTDGIPGIPINLQINIPSPTDLYPSITIVTAPTNTESSVSTFPPYEIPPLPPMIMRRSRSCLRSLLPILLLALIDDCGCCGYGCNCDYDDPIPIPYPIPIPVNNPIVNYSGYCSQCSSRNRK